MKSLFKINAPLILKTNDNGQVEHLSLDEQDNTSLFQDGSDINVGCRVKGMTLTLWPQHSQAEYAANP